MKIKNNDDPAMDPQKFAEIRRSLLEYNRNYRENKGKIRDLTQYDDYFTKYQNFDKIALDSIVIASLLAIYKLSFANITSIPLLPEKIELLIEKVEEVVKILGLGSAGVSLITHTIASYFGEKARSLMEKKELSVTEIEKYYADKSQKERGR